MKKRILATMLILSMGAYGLTGCGQDSETEGTEAVSEAVTEEETEETGSVEEETEEVEKVEEASQAEAEEEEGLSGDIEVSSDKEAADEVASMIDGIYVQEWTEDTADQCAAAREAWDTLSEEQKELVEGEFADPDYYGRDTGDASADDPLNQDEIGENEILVVSFGTSFNDSRAQDIGGIEKAIATAYPEWSVRRAFTAQIIINHVLSRDGIAIDNMTQALDRAVENGVKNLIVQPTHLMQGAEYDEMVEVVNSYADKFESIKVSNPLLGQVGASADEVNSDKEEVAKAITAAAVADASYDSLEAAEAEGVAFVFMGHGTSHTAKVTYSQMQTQVESLGYKNVFIGTVEGEPEETAVENVIESVAAAGYKTVVLRPLMVVAGDHANNDMAGDDDDSWKSMMLASGKFDNVEVQISGLGRIETIEQIYVDHIADVMAE
ncbi:MAG: sirohydrochlorin cobaltochelatase [Eubacterium sp.]|nr:sirohydrochlorin cobaltochelatase [Eubacterium sp.]